MGWNEFGQNAEKTGVLPIVQFKENELVRLRLIVGPGKYDSPQKRFQHWPDNKNIAQPVGCIGPRAGCIFHQAPLNWRTSARACMNCVVYTMVDGQVNREIRVLVGGNQIFGAIKDACDINGIDPPRWIG